MTERGMPSTFTVEAFRTWCQMEGAMSGYDSALSAACAAHSLSQKIMCLTWNPCKEITDLCNPWSLLQRDLLAFTGRAQRWTLNGVN